MRGGALAVACALAAALASACIFGSEAREDRDLSQSFAQQSGQAQDDGAAGQSADQGTAQSAQASAGGAAGQAAAADGGAEGDSGEQQASAWRVPRAPPPPQHFLEDLSVPPETPLAAVQRFFHLIEHERYEDAWSGITQESRDVVPRDAFAQRYRDIAAEATIRGVSWAVDWQGDAEARSFDVILRYQTTFYGEIEERVGALVFAQPDYVVHWTPDLIFNGLNGRGYLIRNNIITPDRGRILDRNGEPVAEDRGVAIVGLYREAIDEGEEEEVIAFFTERLGLAEAEVRGRLNSSLPASQFVPVASLPIDTPQALLDEYETLTHLGILLRFEPRRYYPYGDSAAHVIGYLQEINAEELAARYGDGYRSGDLVGRDGIERSWDESLAGRRGGQMVIIDANAWPVRVIAERKAAAGSDIRLTLDIRVQQLAEQALGDQPGAVVALDPRDGHIIAMASYPRIDLNDIVDGFTQEEADRYFSDERQPFVNRALQQIYAPGSTFKTITLAAALQEGGFAIDDRISCPALWSAVGQEPLRNWKTVDRGPMPLSQALAESCNTVFYEIGLSLDRRDPALLSRVSGGFGFGLPTGVVGLHEEAGVNPSPDWKRANRGDRWYTGDTLNASIGQGFVAVTALQMANAYAAIATTGVLYTPLAVIAVEPPGLDPLPLERRRISVLPVSSETLGDLQRSLRDVVGQPYGTGYLPFRDSALEVAGKSGTAEDRVIDVQSIASVETAGDEEEAEETDGESDTLQFEDEEEEPAEPAEVAPPARQFSTHAWFAAWADYRDPRLVVAVVLDDGASGADNAGPIVRQVLEGALNGGLVE